MPGFGLHGNPLRPDAEPRPLRAAGDARRGRLHGPAGLRAGALRPPDRLWATTSGCYRNSIPLPRDQRTVAHAFAEAGHATGYIGKWHLADGDLVRREQCGGYGSWLASNLLEFTSEAYRTTVYDEAMEPVRLPGYRVDALTDAAIRFVDKHRGGPFYLFVSLLEPHHLNRLDNHVAPDGYRERYGGGRVPPDLAALGGSTH